MCDLVTVVPAPMPEGCTRCALAAGRTRIVVSRGNARAPRLVVVGEAPGAHEDREGLPFVGRSGRLLDRWLAAWGLGEDDVLVTNVARCRPPANRKPTLAEQDACGAHLLWLLASLGDPPVLALGRTAEGWLKTQGRAPLFIYHPSYYLRGYRKWEGDVAALAPILASLSAKSP